MLGSSPNATAAATNFFATAHGPAGRSAQFSALSACTLVQGDPGHKQWDEVYRHGQAKGWQRPHGLASIFCRHRRFKLADPPSMCPGCVVSSSQWVLGCLGLKRAAGPRRDASSDCSTPERAAKQRSWGVDRSREGIGKV